MDCFESVFFDIAPFNDDAGLFTKLLGQRIPAGKEDMLDQVMKALVVIDEGRGLKLLFILVI